MGPTNNFIEFVQMGNLRLSSVIANQLTAGNNVNKMKLNRETPEIETLMTGLAFGESPRWHNDRLWFSNWVAQEVIAVDLKGKSEIIVRMPSFPFSIDWLPDGRLLLVSGREGLLLCLESNGSLSTHADLRGLTELGWNEIVVDGRGNAYINGGPGIIALVTPDGSARQVADGIAFPNGMAITPDNSTLIIAESFGKRLTAFDIARNGSLSNRRVWADFVDAVPDGICMDEEGAIWYGDVPNKRCVRVREGGEVLQTINLDRGCFACMLGGKDRRTLFMMSAEWHGFDKMTDSPRTGQVQTIQVPAPGVGWP
jgi:sugar lactone lactonase YvrE